VGAICWFTETAHAAPLTDEFFAAVQDSVPTASSDIIPPWELFDVGAPKKKGMGKAVSKRGAHLKRGSGHHFLDRATPGSDGGNVVSVVVGNGAAGGDELSADVVPDVPPDLGLPRPQCSSSVGLGVTPVPFLQKRIQGLDSSSDDSSRCPAPSGDELSVDVVPDGPPDLGLPRPQCSSSVGLGVIPVPILTEAHSGSRQ
jgi:hypothetical protein